MWKRSQKGFGRSPGEGSPFRSVSGKGTYVAALGGGVEGDDLGDALLRRLLALLAAAVDRDRVQEVVGRAVAGTEGENARQRRAGRARPSSTLGQACNVLGVLLDRVADLAKVLGRLAGRPKVDDLS